MTRSQKYISTLLERLPKWELRSYDHQMNLDRIRDRISSTSDIQQELRYLYQVKGFTEFALGLMWIMDKVEKDTTLEESTLDEETLIFSKFRQAVGDITAPTQESVPTPTMFDLPAIPGFESTFPSTTEPAVDSLWGGSPQSTPTSPSISDVSMSGDKNEHDFALLLERFLESVQSGNDDRATLSSDVINGCNAVIANSAAAEDYRKFCQLLIDFLQYILTNQFLDDVRVMNIVSNIQEPFSQWARSGPDNRAGMLDQAIDILRDFKTMFE
jgi:hypothetical protein